ncbi:methyltransferase family protein [Pseudonocardia sediminis]|uniref:Methyltransferase family protein n=1 Tax=Pseudonocardia sediminis TaxID=1397368 RepID=A0A4V6MEB5_PSEST|nr:class I SAM-dependent methyltransferase [Pseudonocardia sediminis]RZT86160.1 methyltransferase family protein [Pseudonocardia sediminis]
MAGSDRELWDSRHAVVSMGEPMPPAAVLGREHLLRAPGRALDVACGRGAVSVWLALRGFTVDAVDVSTAGLEGGAELAGRHGVADRVRWIRADLDDGLPTEPLVADVPDATRRPHAGGVPGTEDGRPGTEDGGPGYDLVVCQRFREPSLYPVLAAALRPGGLLVVTVLSEVGDSGGRFRAGPGELLAAFGGLDVVDHLERDGEASLLARRRP